MRTGSPSAVRRSCSQLQAAWRVIMHRDPTKADSRTRGPPKRQGNVRQKGEAVGVLQREDHCEPGSRASALGGWSSSEARRGETPCPGSHLLLAGRAKDSTVNLASERGRRRDEACDCLRKLEPLRAQLVEHIPALSMGFEKAGL